MGGGHSFSKGRGSQASMEHCNVFHCRAIGKNLLHERELLNIEALNSKVARYEGGPSVYFRILEETHFL